jgi:cytochrome P450
MRFNPYSPLFQDNPFAYYSELLDKGPVHRTRTGIYIAVGYDECRQILTDARFLRAPANRRGYQISLRDRSKLESQAVSILLNLDHPQHDVVRNVFSLPFSNRNVRQYEGVIREKSRHLVKKIPNSGYIDLVEHYASPLTVFSIKLLLGLMEIPDNIILNFAKTNIHFLEFRIPAADEINLSEKALDELFSVLSPLLKNPKAGAFLHQLASSIQDGLIDEETALANLAFLISAGFETTISLICGGFYLLSRTDDQADVESKLVFDEVLRLSPPIHLTSRIVGEDLYISNTELNAGCSVIVAIAAASRDPRAYEEPDRFIPNRKKPAPLSFGMGAHYCLGVNLARLEAHIAWVCLLERFGRGSLNVLNLEFENRAAIRTPRRLIVRA